MRTLFAGAAILLAAARTCGAHHVACAGRGGLGGKEGGEGGGGQGGDPSRSGAQAWPRAAAKNAQDGHACRASGAERNPHASRRADPCTLAAHGVRAAAIVRLILKGVAATQLGASSRHRRRCQCLAGVRRSACILSQRDHRHMRCPLMEGCGGAVWLCV